MAQTGSWEVRVLGSVSLSDGTRTVKPDRRCAALLAYLALEGPAPRSRLAGLLWPASPESTARNNLSQALRRLRRATGDSLVEGEDPLRLAPHVTVDAAAIRSRSNDDGGDRLDPPPGDLLDGLDFEDTPEFAEWLAAEREAWRARQARELAELADRLEDAGRIEDAIVVTERRIALDPLAEPPYRRLMRLHHRNGDRPSALRAYRACRDVLHRELGVEPMPETRELAHRIDRSDAPPASPARPRQQQALPPEVFHPPTLVGREEAWTAMQEAWSAGKFIVLAGAAGVGKSRLAHDFAASKGAHLVLEGRPGDRFVPLATTVRDVRRLLEQRPDAPLAPWVRNALAPLLPELNADAGTAPGRQGPRIHQAVLALMTTDLGVNSFVYDDLQYADDASIEAGFYVLSSSFPLGRAGGVPRWVGCVRADELAEHTRDILFRAVAAGHCVWIELAPLEAEATQALLDSLHLQAHEAVMTPDLAAALHRRTGGNPLFLLETLRDLIEARRRGEDLTNALPRPDRVDAIIRQRLSRLSGRAQHVIQAAAVLQGEFDLDLVGRVLDLAPVELLSAWAELERAQVFHGDAFSHDLLYETALTLLAEPVRTLLNRKAAAALEAVEAPAARVAQHHLAAGDRDRAGRSLVLAGHAARGAFLFREAEALYARAFDLLRETGDEDAAFEALFRRAMLLLNTAPCRDTLGVTARLLGMARTDRQRAMAHEAHARMQHLLAAHADAETTAAAGVDWAARAGDPRTEGGNLEIVGLSQLHGRRWDAARATFDRMERCYRAANHPIGVATAVMGLGRLQWLTDHRQALSSFERAEAIYLSEAYTHQRITALNLRALVEIELGRIDAAEDVLRRATAAASQVEGEIFRTVTSLHAWAQCHHARHHYASALEKLDQGIALATTAGFVGATDLLVRSALVRLALGDREGADTALRTARSKASGAGPLRFPAPLAVALLHVQIGDDDHGRREALLLEALQEAEASRSAFGRAWVLLEWVPYLPAEDARTAAEEALRLSASRGLDGLRGAAETRLARALLRTGDPAAALAHSVAALTVASSSPVVSSPVVSPGERWLTHARALRANGGRDAEGYADRARRWLLETADREVPPPLRAAFLGRSPVARDLLEGSEADPTRDRRPPADGAASTT